MELIGKKIIFSGNKDNSVYFVHSLTKDKELIEKHNDYLLFYCKKYDFFIYYITNLQPNEYIISTLKDLCKNNYVHFVMSDFNNELIIEHIEKEMDFSNFDYSIVYNFGETIENDKPYNLKKYSKLKYFFSSTEVHKKNLFDWKDNNSEKFIFNAFYGFIYAYFKFGLNNVLNLYEKYENKNLINKVFVYTKVGDRTDRINAVNAIKNLDRFYKKEFNIDDWFWYYTNYNQYHVSFYMDYTTCKINLIYETFDEVFTDISFATEKTLKGLITNTPFYVSVNKFIVNELHKFGFYTLNKNFENYEKFITFMKECSDDEFETLYLEAKEKSKNNKKILEDYIYSDKVKEINLLINK